MRVARVCVLAALCVPLAATACGGGSSTASSSPNASGSGLGGGAVSPPAGSGSPGVASPLPPPGAVPAGLPFTFQGGGQGGSPPFAIPAAGAYKVTYQLSAEANQAPCVMSIALSRDADSVTIIDQAPVAPGAPRDGTTPVTLAAGTWRAIEGGGCAWSVTVSS